MAIVGLLAIFAGTGLAATKDFKGFPVVRVLVNGQDINSDVPAIIMDGRTLLPVRAVSEALSSAVEWDEQTRTVSLSSGGRPPTKFPSYLVVNDGDQLTQALAKWEEWILHYDGMIVLGATGSMWHKQADVVAFVSGTIDATEFIRRAEHQSANKTPTGSSGQTPAGAPSPVPVSPPDQTGGGIGPTALVIAEDGTYLGVFSSNTFDPESICNPYGLYGSKYGLNSIWNTYGLYGSNYGLYSAFNEYSISPPMIVVDGRVMGYLTTNRYKVGTIISPLGVCRALQDAGM